jgi:VWFA-related protein
MRNVLLGLALSLSSAVSAQVSETIEIRVTNVDVVVTDKSGKPVTGLTAADFEIVEAGKPQAVTNFYEVRGTAPAVTAEGQPAPAVTPDPAVKPARRRIVVFIDNSSVHPHARKQMLEAFEKSLDRLMGEGDQAMLVFFDGVGTNVLTPLTSDRAVLQAKLAEAAKKSGGSFAVEGQKSSILENARILLDSSDKDHQQPTDSSNQRPEPGTGGPKGSKVELTVAEAYSMARSPAASLADQIFRTQRSVIQQLGQTIDSISAADGKKVVVFIGGELADNPGAEILQRLDAMFEPHLRGKMQVANRDPGRSLSVDLKDLAARANAAGVTMYLIDASDKRGNSSSAGSLAQSQPEMMTANDTSFAMTHVAALTGGISVPGGKQFQTALDTIERDLSSYYSLGYRSDSRGSGRIEVRVKNKPALRVRTRQTFTAAPAQLAAAPAPAPAAPAAAAVPEAPAAAGSVPQLTDDVVRTRLLASVHDDDVRGDFPVTVTASAPQPQGNNRAQTDLTITFPTDMTLIEEDGSLKGRVAVYLVTSNAEGRTSAVSTEVKELKFPLGTRTQVRAQKTFTFTVPLLIGKGPVNVSVAVADQLAGTSGFAKTRIVAQ